MSKITIEQIKETLAQDKWKLISQEYKNLDSELVFECDEGHKVYSTWKKQRDKRFCPICQQNQLKQMTKEIVSKPKGVKRTLALDQASHLTGWAIFDNEQLVKYGVFEAVDGDNPWSWNSDLFKRRNTAKLRLVCSAERLFSRTYS